MLLFELEILSPLLIGCFAPPPIIFPPVLKKKKVSFVKAKFIDELRCNQHAQLEKQEGAAVNHFR